MRRARAVVAALSLLLASHAPVAGAHLNGPIRLPWYGPGYYGNRTACGQKMTRYLRGVATWKALPCGTLVELRWNGQRVTVPVVDRMPRHSWAVFDATPWVACHGLNPPRLDGTCFTRSNVYWRVIR